MWNIAGRVALAILPAFLIWYFDRQYRRETMRNLNVIKQIAEKSYTQTQGDNVGHTCKV